MSVLTSDERELRAELIVHIAGRTAEITAFTDLHILDALGGDKKDLKGVVVWHQSTTSFEKACLVLKESGAVRGLNNKGEPSEFGPFFQFLYDINQIKRHVQALSEPTPTLSSTLEAFLRVTSDMVTPAPATLAKARQPSLFRWITC